MPPADTLPGLDAYVSQAREDYERLLGRLVRIPSISSDPRHEEDVRRCAEVAADMVVEMGGHAEVFPTDGYPVVLGRFHASAEAPTVTVYNHLDVQPAEEPGWTRDPFLFAVEEDRFYGRGCTDDKGPAVTALLAARYAAEHGLPVNVRLLWELEEEIGSRHFEAFLAPLAETLPTDVVAVSDTVWLSRERPALPYALRGLCGGELVLETGTKDVHSGLTGGAARNPLGELCQVLDRCHDAATGEVRIPGFYDDVVPMDEEEMESFLASGFDVERFRQAHGLTRMRSMDPQEVLERIWCRPTFEVHGLVGGHTGPGMKGVVPPRAVAKVSMRLVPNQDPAAVLRGLEAFVKEVNPDVEVRGAGIRPYMGSFRGPYVDAAREAIEFGFGRKPAMVREGGSIGAVLTMEEHLGAPIVFLGLSLPEHSYHGPNENFDWGQASGGMKAFAMFFQRVAAMAPG